jgi:hypothetical protein
MRLKLALSLSACRQARSPNEIDNASRVGRECARPDWIRRFIRGSAEDAKFEESRDPSSTQPQMQDSGKPEDAEAANAERCEIRGNSKITSIGAPRSEDSGRPED